ncbi:hypothetical protein [Acetobacterium sp.]|uniref:hypothetical protein n=1 Tax=Acetobacterium sp. TaxID=1872094 RepID=UPI003594731A
MSDQNNTNKLPRDISNIESLETDTNSTEKRYHDEEEITEDLLCETLPPQKQRKKLFIIIGVVAGIFILTALAFVIPAQMKTSEINKALDLGEKIPGRW